MDLIVDPESPKTNGTQNATSQSQTERRGVDEAVDNDDKLEGAIVRLIWKKSGLLSTRLAEIWYVTSTSLRKNVPLITAHLPKGMNVILQVKVPLT